MLEFDNTIAADLCAKPDFLATPEADLVREVTNLSRQNFSIDTNFYPLGSCTMKYNPRIANTLAQWPGFSELHPMHDEADCQGVLEKIYNLQQQISVICAMPGVSLSPMAGAQGEFAGVAMIKAYHADNQDHHRTEMLVPNTAHGTNPASAVMAGFEVIEIDCAANGDIDIEDLQRKLSDKTAGIMLTNPSTLGVYESEIRQVADLVHTAGGLLYYDGANLNAILGRFCPGDMGFDVMHLNTHKTFATPHGGGGPGAGPIACCEKLIKYLPVPTVDFVDSKYKLTCKSDRPSSIGRLSAFHGNMGVLWRAYIYLRRVGVEGLGRVSGMACLNANYLQAQLSSAGFTLAYPTRRASHEFLITLAPLTKSTGVRALDFAKRLLDYGFHAPTIYFPLTVPECLLIEPTETENKATLDAFISAMCAIKHESETTPELVKSAPHNLKLSRVDEVRAARQPCLSD
jgi:glycine dehydrogenase subunit 2